MAIGTLPAPIKVSDTEAWKTALAFSRPVLTHINGDTTWLVQLPLPVSERTSGRSTFNILLDPWLQGSQSDVASWFSTRWHVVAPSVSTIAELNSLLAKIEGTEVIQGATQGDGGAADGGRSYIDAVAISHEFSDHCHKATLEELPKNTPIFAPEKAADLIRSWSHFDVVTTTPGFSGGEKSWKVTLEDKSGALPPWLGIGRVANPGNALYYHSAIMIAFDLEFVASGREGTVEAILYSPHGIRASDLECVKASGVQTLALLHGLHDVQIWMTKQLNLGGRNGAEAVHACGAKYWIATHDEVTAGGGLVSYFLQRKVYHPRDVSGAKDGDDDPKDYEFAELGPGEMMVLK